MAAQYSPTPLQTSQDGVHRLPFHFLLEFLPWDSRCYGSQRVCCDIENCRCEYDRTNYAFDYDKVIFEEHNFSSQYRARNRKKEKEFVQYLRRIP
jgi:hypothetical protein